ncbi:MAG TPA: 16S rRNA (guanine(527)-N(7))-methyltransferase RsmG [Clostridiaceae bacterium]|jgi:16S rRNA (guanine527-N7)-methyltransferase|nr:16S rRNA (guanine(527)-N(7))-methyltransferase RsmG [Clostridiaceae bacterium]HBN28328.1 16S rRNA (guanine(527)-N(7))-methyltransferase RsmG [Clostridiaceae bacterium]HBX47864.1 16S rRNA (guanine(527)-N(7))-methyltransferase RsmG [Clostridiaceae bacterium]
MNNEEILINGCKLYNIDISKEQINMLLKYMDMLKEWNKKVNLTSIVDDEEIIKKHFLDSISIFNTELIKDNISLVDVGTGAGFPGIPIKIINPTIKVTLIDSLKKRVNFLEEVICELKLKGINAVHGRCEDFANQKDYREQYDIATARAVASLPVLCEYCLPYVKIGGSFIAMKGPSVIEELDVSGNAVKVMGGELKEVIDTNIYGEDLNHKLVVVKKKKLSPIKYPRKAGKIEKNPII